MAFTEVTNESWFSRIGSSIKGILFGIVLFVVAFPLLFWNEGRAVYRAKTLTEGRGMVVADVPNDSVGPENEGKLVHMTGTANSEETLTDDSFGISVDNALKLARRVEMYQWQENTSTNSKKTLGGGKTTETEYSYEKIWSSDEIDSSDFHEGGGSEYGSGNPPMPYSESEFVSNEVGFGAFKLSDSQVGQIYGYESIQLSQEDLDKISDESLKGKLTLANNSFYQGRDPTSPQIGDLRTTFEYVGPSEISFVYQQTGDTFQPYTLDKGNIQLFSMGTVGVEQLFTQAETANNMLTWLLRLAGFVLMSAGIGLVLRPIAVLGDVVPFIGGIVGAGIMFVSAIIAGAFTLVTIAIAWLAFRPLFGIALIVVAIGLIILARRFIKKGKPAPAVAKPDGIPVVG